VIARCWAGNAPEWIAKNRGLRHSVSAARETSQMRTVCSGVLAALTGLLLKPSSGRLNTRGRLPPSNTLTETSAGSEMQSARMRSAGRQ
jgi:hypothetical protein